MSKTCHLCNSELHRHPIIDGLLQFCCAGCHTVFKILSAKNELEDFASHPLFQQALRSGIISNPALLEHIEKQRAAITDDERDRLYIEISNMWCPSCAEIIRLLVMSERGVRHCVVDYATDMACIEFSPRHISKDTICEAIKRWGYDPQPLADTGRKVVSFSLYLRFAVAAFCSLNIMMFAYPLYATYFAYDGEGYGSLFAWLSLFASLPIIFYSAWPIWRRFINSLKVGIFGMETLVTVGVGAAFAISIHELLSDGTQVYFDSMSVVIVFLLLGKIIEAKAKYSAKEALLRLHTSTPKRGRKVMQDGSEQFVPVKEILKGDTLVVLTGEKVVLDGVVTEGTGACDESLMTGESVPVMKTAGKKMLGGTILCQGKVKYSVTSLPEETALQQIINTIERDIGNKSAYVRAADKVVYWFVPLVLCIAFLVAVACLIIIPANQNPQQTAMLRALAILLISCPCAIGIAAPTAESHLLNGIAALGAIVRNRGCLTHLGKESVVVFDKTGTVTEGRFRVLKGLEALTQDQTHILHTLASSSMHPVSGAVASATAQTTKVPLEDVREIAGFGMQARYKGSIYRLGSARLMEQVQIGLMNPNQAEAGSSLMTCLYFAKDEKCLACILLGDQVRSTFADLLRKLGPVRTILLSGDGETPVAAVAGECGFKEWKSLASPLEKKEFIDQLSKQGEVVCMIGDGINDAPALTAANVGISVVSATDMSIQVSDILLTTDNLNILPKIRLMAAFGQKIIRQNLFWAFFYNVIGIFLAAFGWLSPIFATFAMSVSSLTVLFNARRISKM